MKKMNTSPISGMQELLPNEQAVFNRLKDAIGGSYQRHGFLNIETPIIDRTEILFAKAGGDTEKQIYRVYKTAETADSADQALRFDHTVPLARYVVEHENDLAFPFRVSQIGRNFRGERAQKGRFREFYQCDIDIIGRGNLPIEYDTEIIATYADTLKAMDLPEIVIRINNRKLLSGLMENLGVDEKGGEILGIIDHAEKVPESATREHLEELKIGEDAVKKILDFINIFGNSDEVREKLDAFNTGSELYETGMNELLGTLEQLEARGLKDVAIADMMIVRGLDYYTGMVFETFFKNYKNIGAIGGGGRYENLTGYFSDQSFPGVGGSIGLSRLFYILRENKLIEKDVKNPVDYCLIPLSKNEFSSAYQISEKLQKQGYSVDIIFAGKRLADKFSHAGKIGKFAVVIGENEAKSGKFECKNLETGEKSLLVV